MTKWSSTELQIVSDLSLRVPMLSFEQVAVGYFDSDLKVANRCLARLVVAHLLLCYRDVAIRKLHVSGPTFTYNPQSDPPPDAAAWSEEVRSRWNNVIPEPTTLFIASRHAAYLFGSFATGVLPKPADLDHDHLLGDAWVAELLTRAQDAREWDSEAARRRMGHVIAGCKDPDIYVSDKRIVDSAGHYSAAKIQGLIDHADRLGLTLELI